MRSKKRLLRNSQLYAIIDRGLIRKGSLAKIVKEAKGAGVDIIQLRSKEADKRRILSDALLIRKILSGRETLFIVNDYLDIAKMSDSDGIHLGQLDLPIEITRKILGKDKIIGISCHNLNQAKKAQSKGADYIGIGPVFSTSTKPAGRPIGLRILKKIKKAIKIPFFAIGGIGIDNLDKVILAGADKIAVSSGICAAKNTPKAIRRYQAKLRQRL